MTYIKKPAGLPDGDKPDVQGLSPIHAATANTHGILDFLREFKQNVRDGHDTFCMGEANGVPADQLAEWVGESGVFDMIFEFSVMDVPMDASEKWYVKKDWKLSEVKSAIKASQDSTAENGWYPMFWENHDQPRSVSNFFPADANREGAAKVLAAVLMTMRATPFVYQCEELGFANVARNSTDDYDDGSTHDQYEEELLNA